MRTGRKPAAILFYILIAGIFIASTYLTSEVTDVIAHRIPLEREYTVVIDAGHGGEDGGATSCTGVLESRINLEVALKLNDLLHLLGYNTRMIRTTDISVYSEGSTISQKKVSDLKERVRIVNETDNGVLISIHQNTFSDSRYTGAQVFYGAAEDSRALAEVLQEAFVRTLNTENNRGIKKADGIYLMERILCPGILVECGFLSNPDEEALLRNGDYQNKLCCVIAASVGNYLDR